MVVIYTVTDVRSFPKEGIPLVHKALWASKKNIGNLESTEHLLCLLKNI